MKNNSPFHRAVGEIALSRREFLWRWVGGWAELPWRVFSETKDCSVQFRTNHPPIHCLPGCPSTGLAPSAWCNCSWPAPASHLDLFDFKTEFVKHDGEKSDFGEHVEAFQDGLGPWMKPVWEFKPYGKCGKMLSQVVADLGTVADEIAFVHNIVGKTGVHSQATYCKPQDSSCPVSPAWAAG